MGSDQLDWDQTRLNGRLIVEAESIIRYRDRHKDKAPFS